MLLLVLFILTVNLNRSLHASTLYQECAKLFNPQNYMDQLPSLSLPYISNIPLPNAPQIKASPVLTTKVINVVTKYVYKNPVCVKYTKKTMCSAEKHKTNLLKDQIVTKEYFVRDSKSLHQPKKQHKTLLDDYLQKPFNSFNDLDLYMQGSEDPRPFGKTNRKTPTLTNNQVKDLLIEDRLDQLETVLPHYTRRRVYQTSTITVTKVRSNNRVTATLLVKNCMPQGFDLCPPKTKKRKSKVAKYTNSSEELQYYG